MDNTPMPQGMEIYDGQGGKVLSLTDRVTKILGTLIIPNTVEEDEGLLEVPDFATGTPFFFTTGNECKKKGFIDSNGWKHGFWLRGDGGYYPEFEIPGYQVTVTFQSNIMNWHVKKYSKWWVDIKNSSFNIHYGVY